MFFDKKKHTMEEQEIEKSSEISAVKKSEKRKADLNNLKTDKNGPKNETKKEQNFKKKTLTKAQRKRIKKERKKHNPIHQAILYIGDATKLENEKNLTKSETQKISTEEKIAAKNKLVEDLYNKILNNTNEEKLKREFKSYYEKNANYITEDIEDFADDLAKKIVKYLESEDEGERSKLKKSIDVTINVYVDVIRPVVYPILKNSIEATLEKATGEITQEIDNIPDLDDASKAYAQKILNEDTVEAEMSFLEYLDNTILIFRGREKIRKFKEKADKLKEISEKISINKNLTKEDLIEKIRFQSLTLKNSSNTLEALNKINKELDKSIDKKVKKLKKLSDLAVSDKEKKKIEKKIKKQNEKKEQKVISNEDIEKFEELIKKMKAAHDIKKFTEHVAEFGALMETASKGILTRTELNELPDEFDEKALKEFNKLADYNIRNYYHFRPTAIKMKIEKKTDDILFYFAYCLLKVKTAVAYIILPKTILQKIKDNAAHYSESLISGDEKSLLLNIVGKVVADYIINFIDFVDKVLSLKCHTLVDNYHKEMVSTLAKKQEEFNENLEELRRLKTEKKTKKDKKTSFLGEQLAKSKILRDFYTNYLKALKDAFNEGEKEILAREYKKNLDLMKQNFEILEKGIPEETLPLFKDKISRIREILNGLDPENYKIEEPKSTNLENTLRSFADYSFNKSTEFQNILQSTFIHITESEENLGKLPVETAEKTIAALNNCILNANEIHYYLELQVKEQHLSNLYILADKLKCDIKNKYQKEKIKVENRVKEVTNAIKDAKKAISEKLSFITKAAKTVKGLPKTIDEYLSESKLKTLYNISKTTTQGITIVGLQINGVFAQIAKAASPKIGQLLFSLAGKTAAHSIPVPGLSSFLGEISGPVCGWIGCQVFSFGAGLYASSADYALEKAGAEHFGLKVKKNISDWYYKKFPKKDKFAPTTKPINELRESALKVLDTYDEEMIKLLDNKKLTKKLKKLKENLNSDNPEKFFAAFNSMGDFFKTLTNDLEKQINDPQSMQKLYKKFKNPEETRLKLLTATAAFYEATKRYKDSNDIQKFVGDPTFLNNSLFILKRAEKHFLKAFCAINYVLVPVSKFVFPLAAGVGLGVLGTSLGASLDASTFGASVGIFSILGGVAGGILGSIVGNALSGAYGWIDKKSRERLGILQKELAIYDAYNLAIQQEESLQEEYSDFKEKAKEEVPETAKPKIKEEADESVSKSIEIQPPEDTKEKIKVEDSDEITEETMSEEILPSPKPPKPPKPEDVKIPEPKIPEKIQESVEIEIEKPKEEEPTIEKIQEPTPIKEEKTDTLKKTAEIEEPQTPIKSAEEPTVEKTREEPKEEEPTIKKIRKPIPQKATASEILKKAKELNIIDHQTKGPTEEKQYKDELSKLTIRQIQKSKRKTLTFDKIIKKSDKKALDKKSLDATKTKQTSIKPTGEKLKTSYDTSKKAIVRKRPRKLVK